MGKSMLDLQDNGKQVTTLSDTDLLLATTDPSGTPDDAVIEWGDVKNLISFMSPITCNMLTRDPTSVGQGTWTRSVLATVLYCGVFVNGGTDGDNFTVNFYLPVGTYKIRFSSVKNTNRGIVKVEVGATNLGNTDLYAAALGATNIVEYTGISISTAGLYPVKFTVNGKNASSSGYFIDVEEIEFIRTA